jgi:hypothetical protein
MLDSKATLTEREIEKALERPRSFGYAGDQEGMFETWSLGPIIRTRDSDLREQSNADALIKHLESDSTLADDWRITGASHWAVGWVDHLSFRVVEADGKTPTRIARVLKEWSDALASYPVADESDLSRREYEATLENIESAGRRMVVEAAPEDWPARAFGWFWDHDQRAVEARDGGGGYPSDEQMRACLRALGWLDEE